MPKRHEKLSTYIRNQQPNSTYPSLAGWGDCICCDCGGNCCWDFLSSLIGVEPGWFTCTPWSIVGDLRVTSDGVAERDDPPIRSRTEAK